MRKKKLEDLIPEPRKCRSIAELLGAVGFSPDDVVTAAAANSVLFCDAADHRKDTVLAKAEAEMAMDLDGRANHRFGYFVFVHGIFQRRGAETAEMRGGKLESFKQFSASLCILCVSAFIRVFHPSVD